MKKQCEIISWFFILTTYWNGNILVILNIVYTSEIRKWILFTYLKETEIFHLQAHSPEGYNARAGPSYCQEPRASPGSLTLVEGTWIIQWKSWDMSQYTYDIACNSFTYIMPQWLAPTFGSLKKKKLSFYLTDRNTSSISRFQSLNVHNSHSWRRWQLDA